MVACPSCGEDNPPKFRLCGYCGTPLAAAAPALPVREVRKTVTIVFCDLKDSTALGERLDAEALHEVKGRYFEAMAAQIVRHGGKVEKYIGDAIMAVFGLPRAHEDDALRAVRAAAGMRTELARLNADLGGRYGVALANRTGINTGEVVANDDPTADQQLATGDAVNLAARLEQAAPPGEIYLGELTWRLVRDAVEVEPVEPLALKGKSSKVPALRLVAVRGQDGLVRRHDRPLVGRDAELAALQQAWHEATTQRTVRTVTLVADAGFGKSRLVLEVIDRIAAGARVLAGRCLPYGEGITFWPLLMMLRDAAGIRDSDRADAVLARLRDTLGDADVADRLISAAGLGGPAFPLGEINWAARRFVERQAADTPLLVFVDDIHWAEPAFLDLLDHVQQQARDVPVLVLATARHDLLESRPEWCTQPGTQRIALKPLSDEAATRLVTQLLGATGLPGALVGRVVRAAEGNPLYAEQMLSMLVDAGTLRQVDGRWALADDGADIAVPPTIQALLEARLDRLDRTERAAVEPASVIGLEFAQSAVESLAPDALRAALTTHLGSLARKQFIRPAQPTERDLVYRFHHHLVRETVYNGLLKRARAQMHLQFVRWADRVNAADDRGREFEEILGYHLEQAHRYLRELGPLDADGLAAGRDASRRLGSSGRRAAARGDMHAAAGLLRRAAATLEPDDAARPALLPPLAEALMSLGDFAGARAALDEALAAADRHGDERVRGAARVQAMFVRLYSGDGGGDWSEASLRVADEVIPVLDRLDASAELAAAWRLVVLVHGIAGRYQKADEAGAKSIAHARRAGSERVVARNGLMMAMNALHGPLPVPEAIAQCEQLLAAGLGERQIECNVRCALAQLRAMNGELDAARTHYRQARAMLRELGQGVYAASTAIDLARVELQGGDLAQAQREAQADADFLAAKGETYFLSTLAALIAKLAREQGRDAEALALTRTAEAASGADDVESQALWRMVRAPLLARQGDAAGAEAMAREAVALARGTEASMLQAEALAELAAVLRAAGRDGWREAVDEALALYAAKGHRAAAQRLTDWAAR